jgi:hypothetical protein
MEDSHAASNLNARTFLGAHSDERGSLRLHKPFCLLTSRPKNPKKKLTASLLTTLAVSGNDPCFSSRILIGLAYDIILDLSAQILRNRKYIIYIIWI